MLSYLLNYKIYHQTKGQSSTSTPVQRLHHHVGAADGLRNGGLEDQVTAEHFVWGESVIRPLAGRPTDSDTNPSMDALPANRT